MLRIFVSLLLSVTLLTGCVPNAQPHSAAKPTAQSLTQDLKMLSVQPAYISYLAQEGLQAGVRGFAPLPAYRNAGRKANAPRLYGLTLRNRIVYLDRDTEAGRSPFIILHEISHAAHYGGACGGHNSTWAADFAQRAARFQAQFPEARWLGQPPVHMARNLAQQYGIGTKCP